MIVNIALNTIIYIMVFLFPGIIFRRTFFSGKFRNNFDSGSNFERLLWSILVSVACISVFCFFAISIDGLTHDYLSGLVHITERDILCVFEEIYSNQYPETFRTKESLFNVFFVFFFLYTFSGFLGWLIKQIVFVFKLEKSVSFLKFENQWDYLAVSNKVNNPLHKFGDRTITEVDVKTEEDLFTGKFHQFLLDKDGKVESIVLKETYKFVTLDRKVDRVKISEMEAKLNENTGYILSHSNTGSTCVYKKQIRGQLFSIEMKQVKNISMSYITVSNIMDRIQVISNTLLTIILGLSGLFAIAYSIWDFGFISFESTGRRIVFCIFSFITMIPLCLFIYSIFDLIFGKKENRKDAVDIIRDALLIGVYFSIPFLYSFSIIKGGIIIITMIGAIPILGMLLSKSKNQDDNLNNESNANNEK